jgi:hypothetical protein
VVVMGVPSVGLTDLSYESVGSSRWSSAAEISSESEGKYNLFFVFKFSRSTKTVSRCIDPEHN